MKYRKLRIAWSVAWGIACVLLIVLWVRSYTTVEFAIWVSSGGRAIGFESELGGAALIYETNSTFDAGWWYFTDEIPSKVNQIEQRPGQFRFGPTTANRTIVFAPIWFLVFGCGIAATFPWFCYRFSLRTLLVATTLVAAALGLVVWLR
jgi:hypothetical protein